MEIRRAINNRKRMLGWLCALLGFVVLAVFVSVTSAIVFVLFLVVLMLGIDNGIPMIAALALLLLCTALLALDQKFAAETLANWAYSFLAISIVVQLINYIKSDADKSGDTD
jgi:hypothetical protein